MKYKKTNSLKVLNLSLTEDWSNDNFFCNKFREEAPTTYGKSNRKINRFGKYLDRKTKECWFENSDGSWKYDPVMFQLELDVLNASELKPEQIEGLQYMGKCNLITKKQREMLWHYKHYLQLKITQREIRKSFM